MLYGIPRHDLRQLPRTPQDCGRLRHGYKVATYSLHRLIVKNKSHSDISLSSICTRKQILAAAQTPVVT